MLLKHLLLLLDKCLLLLLLLLVHGHELHGLQRLLRSLWVVPNVANLQRG